MLGVTQLAQQSAIGSQQAYFLRRDLNPYPVSNRRMFLVTAARQLR